MATRARGAQRAAAARLSLVDLVRRTAVVRVVDDGRGTLPHVLRGMLAGFLGEPWWHVVVVFDTDEPRSPEVVEVLTQARQWAEEAGCRLTVARMDDLAWVTQL